MTAPRRILITPGEPAGIGPDITIQIAQQAWSAELVVIADPEMLLARAAQLKLPLKLRVWDGHASAQEHEPGALKIYPVHQKTTTISGVLNAANSDYVLQTLQLAATFCQQKTADALVTGPVNKAIMNAAHIPFTGHTEFFAQHCQVAQTVMLFVVDQLKVALVTTHLPLHQVASHITAEKLKATLLILNQALKQLFDLATPHIFVCGLNPHAGENGYLGHEEQEVIEPVLAELRQQHYHLTGPLAADTIFTPFFLQKADAVLAMYHDQALPLVKYIGFGHAVNVTLGLPFIRTSVDHGTALDVAGTGHADSGSLKAAIDLALLLSSNIARSSTF